MKEIKRNVTESKTLYEISEDELIEIKRKERAKGRQDVVEYIDFAFCNYIYKMNIGGVFSFINSLIKFCRLEINNIDNHYKYNFFDFVKKYRN